MANPPKIVRSAPISPRELRKLLIQSSKPLLPFRKKSLSGRFFASISRSLRKQSKLWRIAWEEFGRTRGYSWVRRGTGLLAFALLTVAGQSLYGVAHWFFPILPWYGWLLTFSGTTILAQVFVIHYSGIAHERVSRTMVDEYEEKIWVLEDRLRPHLTIDYRPEEGEPFIQTGQGVTQYRVSVKSPVSVPDTELVVHRVTIDGTLLFDLHLRPMHDRSARGTKRVNLQPDKENYWDVITRHDDAIILNCIASHGFMVLPAGDHEFQLMASGGERPPVTRVAIVTIGEDHTVKFSLQEEREPFVEYAELVDSAALLSPHSD